MTHTIVDNFLPQEAFEEVRDLIMGGEMPLYQGTTIDNSLLSPEEKSKARTLNKLHGLYTSPELGLTHMLFSDFMVHSDKDFYNAVLTKHLLRAVNPLSLIRAKINFSYYSGGIEGLNKGRAVQGWHTDIGIEKGYYTAIYYLNDCSHRCTLLEDGTVIDTKANRLAVFPGDTLHTQLMLEAPALEKDKYGVRAVINLNFTMPTTKVNN